VVFAPCVIGVLKRSVATKCIRCIINVLNIILLQTEEDYIPYPSVHEVNRLKIKLTEFVVAVDISVEFTVGLDD